MSQSDTIFAPATPIGGAICMLRVSGAKSAAALFALSNQKLSEHPRRMTRVRLIMDGRQLDDAMAVYYPAPGSYTGEDMAEVFCHGGPAVVRAVQNALISLGLRPAEPGEFTRRAFLNGKMDLVEAEAVMDLIQSTAERAADAAMEQLQGRLSREITNVETLLTEALSGVSAAIDYPEELEEDVFSALPGQLIEAENALSALIAQGKTGRVLREGFRVALAGRPNSGKSSLMNALLGYPRAIVTPKAGTTRDVLEEQLSLDGIPVRLSDTAGLREAEDEAEREGVSRAFAAMQQADLVLLLLDGSVPLTAQDRSLLEETRNIRRILLRTKADLPAAWGPDALLKKEEVLPVSANTGEGLGALADAVRLAAGPVSGAYVTNARHVSALEEALGFLKSAQNAPEPDCMATDLRGALLALGSITGKAVDETVIGRIFERFCVGK
ncbi:MAG TPA: tRNA uridine-5-carboxymethylaminomethyl(34) synthesis GTPase MnmE [Feifaniaceae bacterium]|nr:tRNA uridine-5-carboxymethylaminomethyl(34) synthesis GTPase MnmE [Feifaniaceae bacterium]